MNVSNHTALVTGANSGLGFLAAARFAELGYRRVILATRSNDKGVAARARLIERTGRDPFDLLTVDVTDLDGVAAAVEVLRQRGERIDVLLLNAGVLGGPELHRTEAGVERTFAASVIGHHTLTVGLLRHDLLAPEARIVHSGSEAARGDMAMFHLTDVPSFAAEHFAGDRAAAIAAIAQVAPPVTYVGPSQYAMTKAAVAWWALALSRRLPEGMAVYAVSPGAAPATNVTRHQTWFMRVVAIPLMTSALGRALGLTQSMDEAAERYIDATRWGTERSGEFWASKPGKMIGRPERMTHSHLLDEETAEAAWQAIVGLTGVDVGWEVELERPRTAARIGHR